MKILIIRFSSIGDIIQCMGIISGLRARFEDAEIHWITRKDMAGTVAIDPRIDRIWAFDKTTGLRGLLRMARQLRKEHFDYIYDAHSNIRSCILKAVLAPLPFVKPHVVTRSKERGKRFLLFRLGINRFDKPFRGVVSFRKPLRQWGVTDFPETPVRWQFPKEIEDKYKDFIADDVVTLVPSANWEMKRWPVAYWQELVRLLPAYRFIILAGPQDKFCEEIRNAAPERVTNLAGRTSLMESSYLVSRSHLVVSADTGFLHAADLFRTPALALMGPTAFGFPTGPTAEIMEVSLPCRPCTKDGRGKCKQSVYQRCMIDLTPRTVAERVTALFPR